MRKLIIVFPFFLLTGCALEASYIPEDSQLKDAEVGMPYYSQIYVLGGRASSISFHGKKTLIGKLSHRETGLYVQPCEDEMDNNCVQIRGVPTKVGVVKVRVAGGLSGGMLSSGGSFDKTYTITIKNDKP
ncbi:hypothetical protein [Enterobacter sp.]|uniref:hypothetical protein n=1 Tax=Enterobacter sp. TaxID=42895 RepID=UPI00296EE843|nr:hypothetical protein [Enterobacter sp.]